MSWLSKAIDTILPGDPMHNLTQSTTDKWIRDEDKDMVEFMASMMAAGGAGGLPNFAAMGGAALGIPTAVAGAGIGGLLAKLNNQKVKQGILGGALGMGGLSNQINSTATDLLGTTGGNIASGALQSAITGGNPLIGGAMGGINTYLNTNFPDMPAWQKTAIAQAANMGLSQLLSSNGASGSDIASILSGGATSTGATTGTGTTTGGMLGTTTSGFGGTGETILKNLLASADYSEGKLRDQTMRDIENAMMRRGIRTSGLQMQSMADANADISEAATAGRQKMALDVYNALLSERGQNLGYDATMQDLAAKSALYAQQVADAQSAANQTGRQNLASGVGGLLTQLFFPTVQSYLTDKWNLGQYTNPYQVPTTVPTSSTTIPTIWDTGDFYEPTPDSYNV